MKLRIKGNSLRLRLSQSEVQQFGNEQRVADHISFGPGRQLYYVLEQDTTADALRAVFDGTSIRILVPTSIARHWVETEEVGFETQLNTGETEPLHILVEKDFQCLHRRGEEEADNYPHPAAKGSTSG
jgi:hypothetical protein